ncbi:hypothetical protein IKG20_01195, partial [Candidatus Saccharibacteria bacterium]|nr:hypothetical protein [Candidatus Saccharibacteria bacterium]
MAHINRKYIDSHWLIFVIKGLIAVLIGGYTLFDARRSLATVVTTVGIFLLSFAIIEFVNALYRAR